MATALILSPDESHCVLCCEDIEYTACGICDHPICLKCCVKLRLLRKEYDCPVCRAQLKEVIVSKGYKLYADKTRPRRQQHARNYGILHESVESQEKVDELLQHKCPECNEIYKSFPLVKDHVRRVHSMIYCDICLRNLKIFTHERKCYTREGLVRHRKFGDADDRSHRGHPLCQFCDERYLDNDELLVHLRKNHFWCYLCEKDGSQDYYPHYNELRKHFKQAHFLCEEGECLHEKFTSVFRMKVDYQAHIAQNHSDKLSKAEARQMRQLDINITFASPEESSSIISGRDFSFPEQGQERYRLNGMAGDSRNIGTRDYGGYKSNSREREQDTRRHFPQDRTVKVENRGINLGVNDVGDQGEVRRGNMRTSRDVLEGDHKRPPGESEVNKRIFEGGGRSKNSKIDKTDKVCKSANVMREDEGLRSDRKKGSSDEKLGSASRKEKQQSLDQLEDGNFSSRGRKTEENLSQKRNNKKGESSLIQNVEEGKNQSIGTKKQKTESKNQKEQNEKQEKDSKNQKKGREKKKTERKNLEVENGKQKTESTSQKKQNEKQKNDSENQMRDKQEIDRKSQKADSEKQLTDSKSQKAQSENQKTEQKNREVNSQKPKDLSGLPSDNTPETVENNMKPRRTYDNEFPTLSNEPSKPMLRPPPGLSVARGLSVPPGFDLVKPMPKKNNSPEENSESKQNPEHIGNFCNAVTTSKHPRKEVQNCEKSLVNQSTGKSKTNVANKPFCKPSYDSEFPTLASLTNGHKSSASVKVPPGLVSSGFQPVGPLRPPPGMGWSVPLKQEGSPAKETRNQKLIRDIRRILNLRGESFESFQLLSGSYRNNKTSPESYYEQCCNLLGKEHIHKVFRELIDILPDEDKKRQLLLVYNDAKVRDKLGDSVEEGNVLFNPGSEIVEVANIQPSLEEDFPALPVARTVKNSSAKNVASVWSQGR